MYAPCGCAGGLHELQIPIQEVELAMMVFNTLYGFTRWSAYFSLCMWRLRLKVSRIGA